MPHVVDASQVELAAMLRKIIANYVEAEDLINIGAYVRGSNPDIDEAIKYIGPIREFLAQPMDSSINFSDSVKQLAAIFESEPGKQKGAKG